MVPWGNAYVETDLCPSPTPGSYDVDMRRCWDSKCNNGPEECWDLTKKVNQHGADEGMGNRIEACAISVGNDSALWWPFIYCFEGQNESQLDSAKSCATKVGLDWDSVNTCVTTSAGDKVEILNAKRTTVISHPGTPYLIVAGQPLQDTEELLNAICDAWTGPAPAAC
jgi:interferon gamma-inducible protein 30